MIGIKYLNLNNTIQYYVNIPLTKLSDIKDLAQTLPVHRLTHFNNLLKYLKMMELVCVKIEDSTNILNKLVDELEECIDEKERFKLYLKLKKTYKAHMHNIMQLQKITPIHTRKDLHRNLISILTNHSWHWFFLTEAYYHVDSDLIYQELEDLKVINLKNQEFEIQYKAVWNEEIKYLVTK